MNIKRVLVAVDFSPLSTLAVNYGIAFARQLNAKLSLLHVVESPLVYPFSVEAGKLEAQRKEQAEKMLAALVGPEDEDDLDAHFVVRAGDIEEVITLVVNEEQADVLVMGTHSRGFFGRLLLGSVAHKLLRKLELPVLTVCRASRPLEFKRILFATDFGLDSYKGFRFALDLANATHCSLLVTHTMDARPILSYEVPEISEEIEEGRKAAVKYAHETFAEYQAEGARRKVLVECVLGEGDVPESLVRIADDNEVDFMILGLRKKDPIERALLGSTAEPVIRAAHVPVLSVPIDTKVTVVEDGARVEVGQEHAISS